MSKGEEPLTFGTDSFAHVLIGDVVTAFNELSESDTPTRRRSAVRATFAAIEGLLSMVKVGMGVLTLSPSEISIVREEAYEVSDSGAIRVRARAVPFSRNLKAIVRIIKRLRPHYALDFNHPGWHALTRTLEVRHRLTHPKGLGDLEVSSRELSDAQRGFNWFLAFAIEVMSETNESAKNRVAALRRAMKTVRSEG